MPAKTIILTDEEQTLLSKLSDRARDQKSGQVPKNAHSPERMLKIARETLRLRQQRLEYFDRGMLGEPAYDMLLALYVAEADLQHVSMARLAELADVAPSSAQRWIDYLVGKQLVVRRPHIDDKRAVELKLTTKARDALEALYAVMAFVGEKVG